MNSFFIIDVESIGLHGEGFAVGGGVYLANGAAQWEFRFACPTSLCRGMDEDRQWVNDNIPYIEPTHRSPKAMRDKFWMEWLKAKSTGAVMAADCGWPVEGRFLAQCVHDDLSMRQRAAEAPYPLHEIASYLAAAGMDPLKTYDRLPSELPRHDPMADARQSARMLAEAIHIIKFPARI